MLDHRWRRMPARWFSLALLALWGTASPTARAHGGGTQDAKAELLVHIARFIEWPSTPSSRRQFSFAILGEDELAAVLASTMSRRSIGGLPVQVRCVRRPEDARTSQMVFIAASEEKRIPQILEALSGASVLTVADTGGFAVRGGMVDFLLENDQVRFEINRQQAEKARLKISARLLALAQIVVNQEP